jgi:hypothetical protein
VFLIGLRKLNHIGFVLHHAAVLNLELMQVFLLDFGNLTIQLI